MNEQPDHLERGNLPRQRSEGSTKSGNLDFLQTSFEEVASILAVEDEWAEDEPAENGDRKIFITIFVGFVLLLAISGFTYFRLGISADGSSLSNQIEPSSEKEIKLSEILENSSMEELEAAAEQVTRGLMESKSLDEATHFMVGGDQRLPLLREYYSRSENSFPSGFKKVIRILPNTLVGIFYFSVIVQDQDKNVHQFIAVPAGDKMLIDWACSTAYGELSTEAFFAQKPDSPKSMRFFVKPQPEQIGRKSSIQVSELEPFGLTEFDQKSNDKFLQLSDLNASENFRARVSPECKKCKKLFQFLKGKPLRLPVQLKLIWNHDFQCPEIISLDHFWWFDFEMISPNADPSQTQVFRTE